MDIYISPNDSPLRYPIIIPDDYKSLDANDLLRGRKNQFFLYLVNYLCARITKNKPDDMTEIKSELYSITKKNKFEEKNEEGYRFDSEQYKDALMHFLTEMRKAVFFSSDLEKEPLIIRDGQSFKINSPDGVKFTLNKTANILPLENLTLEQILTEPENLLIQYFYETGDITEDEKNTLMERNVEELDTRGIDFKEGRELLAIFDAGKLPLDDNILRTDGVVEVNIDKSGIDIVFNTYEYYRLLLLKYKLAELRPLQGKGKNFKVADKSRRKGRKVARSRIKMPEDDKEKERRGELGRIKGLKVIYEESTGEGKDEKSVFDTLPEQDIYSLEYSHRISANNETIEGRIRDVGLLAVNDEGDSLSQKLEKVNETYRKDLKSKVSKYLGEIGKILDSEKELEGKVIADMKEGKSKTVGSKGYRFDPKYFNYLTTFLKPKDKTLTLGVVNLGLKFGKAKEMSALKITNFLLTGSTKADIALGREEAQSEFERENKYWAEQYAKATGKEESEKEGLEYKKELYQDLEQNPLGEQEQHPEKFFAYILDNKEEYSMEGPVSLKDFNLLDDLKTALDEEYEELNLKEQEKEIEEGKDFIDEGTYESGEAEETEDDRQERQEALEAVDEEAIERPKTMREQTQLTTMIRNIINYFKEQHEMVDSKESGNRPQDKDISRKVKIITSDDSYFQTLAYVELAPEKSQRIKRQKSVPRYQVAILNTVKNIKRSFNTMAKLIGGI